MIGEDRPPRPRAAAAIASSPPSEPISAASASATRRIVGASAVMATRASATEPPSTRHDGGHPHDRDLHLAPVLEADVARSRSPAPAPARRSRTSSSPRIGRRSPRARSRARRAATVRSPDADRRSADAPKHSSGPPVSIAGEAFITLPPIVPCARVAWDPTIAEASASAVNRSRITRVRHDLVVRDQRAQAQAAVDARRSRRAPRSDRSRRSPRATGPCPGAPRRRGRSRRPPAGPPSRAAASASSTVAADVNDRVISSTPRDAAQTRSGVIGSCRTCAPTTLAIAFAIAPAVGTCGGSPTPLEPRGPAPSVGICTQSTSISGASEHVTSL